MGRAFNTTGDRDPDPDDVLAEKDRQDRLKRAGAGNFRTPQYALAQIQKPKERKRYPSEMHSIARRVTLSLPKLEDRERLLQATEHFNQVVGLEGGETTTPSGMAAKLLLIALEMYEAGELAPVPEIHEIRRMFLGKA